MGGHIGNFLISRGGLRRKSRGNQDFGAEGREIEGPSPPLDVFDSFPFSLSDDVSFMII